MDPQFSTFQLVFQEKTNILAFLIGISFANNLLTRDQKSCWLNFLCSQLPAVFNGDTLETEEYVEICELLEEMYMWVVGAEGPTQEMIDQANTACPKNIWFCPVNFDSWVEKEAGYKR